MKSVYKDVPGWCQLLAVNYDTKTNEIEFVPVVNTEFGITLAKGEEKEDILQSFYKRNEELKSGAWRDGWHEFCESVKEGYLKAIGKAYTEEATPEENHKFAHFLDCEAHHDVWQELCPTANQTNEIF